MENQDHQSNSRQAKNYSCDICGRSENLLQTKSASEELRLRMDEDGLWICYTCQKQIKSKPITHEAPGDLDQALRPLIGKSAGAICRTLELPFVPPYKAVIEAASNIAYDQDRYMSAWLFVTQWQDGTTVWRASDGFTTAFVTPDGMINIQNQ